MAPLVDHARDRAFERMYARYVRDVHRYVLAVLRNPADAEDVTQTTFLNAYRAFKAGERPRMPQNWLITIAHNACRTKVSHARRRPREVPLDDRIATLAVPESDRPSVQGLVQVLGGLPSKQRAALALRELEGRSYEEIAQMLDVSVPAVEALLVRARRRVRAQSALVRVAATAPMPRALRSLWQSGETAGGGALVKAAAVVAAAAAGGAGYLGAEAASGPREGPAPRPLGLLPVELQPRPATLAAVVRRREASRPVRPAPAPVEDAVADAAPATQSVAAVPEAPAAVGEAAPAGTPPPQSAVEAPQGGTPPLPETPLPETPLPGTTEPETTQPALPALPPPTLPSLPASAGLAGLP